MPSHPGLGAAGDSDEQREVFRRLFGRKPPKLEPSPFPDRQSWVGVGYRLEKHLGGQCYLAKNAQALPFVVRFYDWVEEDALLREFKTAQQVSHPNIAPFVDADIRQDNAWMARRYLDGPSAQEQLKQGPHDPDTVIQMMEQLLSALDYLSSHGLVYDSWNPKNIFLNGETWVLADMGYRKTTCRQRIVQVGSPPFDASINYLSPEQITSSNPTTKSDLFSLGALAYHMLCGQPPFGSDPNPIVAVYKALQEDPPAIQEVRPGTPTGLVSAIEQMLTKDPQERPEDIPGLVATLKTGNRSTSKGQPGLQQFLAEARQQGTKADESGRFTLDPQKALAKLSEFQFRQPHHFLLPLVAAASSLGAERLEFSASKRGLKVHYFCPELTAQQVEHILLAAAARTRSNPVSHLGLGLVGALSAGAKKLTLASGTYKTVLTGLQAPVLKSGQRTAGVVLDVSGPVVKSDFPDDLSARVRFSPIPLLWNGQPLSSDPDHVQLGQEEEFLIWGTSKGEHPGLTLRVDGLSYDVKTLPQFGPAHLLIDGPWPLDLSYQAVPLGGRRSELESLAQELLVQHMVKIGLDSPINLKNPEFYLLLLDLMKDPETLDRLNRRIVVAMPAPTESTRHPFLVPQTLPSPLPLLMARCCAHVRSRQLSCSRAASRLMMLPTLYDPWHRKSWKEAVEIAREALPGECPGYWRFLLRSWVKFGGNRMDPLVDVEELLGWLEEIPESERQDWDIDLRERLIEQGLTTPEQVEEKCGRWSSLVPEVGFPATHGWLRKPESRSWSPNSAKSWATTPQRHD